ncbi:DUF1013 domain-containing protein [Pelagibacterales bacterium]|jgi:hypothetical protein|nr:DUF1013 domain-containing protein [Pelagibacterales bacterium]MDB9985943.1 DUF1013 domain-containing protein [Pelagibacterales bacterium]|tara:strand:- start:3913 stop:4548 length:636 start_codon:yes stop_codon:yes gene_type:complete
MTLPLMPKATAIWLVENTALTFRQIADFCGMHELEIKGIADGEVGMGIKGLNPMSTNQLTKEEIEIATKDPEHLLELIQNEITLQTERDPKQKKYTPLSKRQERPDAISWLLRNHPELKDSQIAKLVGSTKNMVVSIKTKANWNMSNIRPQDPVGLGLCKQIDLDDALEKADRSQKRAAKKKVKEEMILQQQKQEELQSKIESDVASSSEE